MSRTPRTLIALVGALVTAGVLTFVFMMGLKTFGLWHISFARIIAAVVAIFIGIGIHMAIADRLAGRRLEGEKDSK